MKRVLDGRPAGAQGLVESVEVEVLQGETHGSVSYPFVHHAMEWLRPRWAVFDANDGDAKAKALVDSAATSRGGH